MSRTYRPMSGTSILIKVGGDMMEHSRQIRARVQITESDFDVVSSLRRRCCCCDKRVSNGAGIRFPRNSQTMGRRFSRPGCTEIVGRRERAVDGKSVGWGVHWVHVHPPRTRSRKKYGLVGKRTPRHVLELQSTCQIFGYPVCYLVTWRSACSSQ